MAARNLIGGARGRRGSIPPELHRGHHVRAARRGAGGAVRGPLPGARRATPGDRLRGLRRTRALQPVREPQLPGDPGLRAVGVPGRPSAVVPLDASGRSGPRQASLGRRGPDAHAVPRRVPRRATRRRGRVGARPFHPRRRRGGAPALLAGSPARHHRRTGSRDGPRPIRGPVPRPGRAAPRRRLHRRVRLRGVEPIREPPRDGRAGVCGRGVRERHVAVGTDRAPRRSRTGHGRVDRGLVERLRMERGVSMPPSRRTRRVGPRRRSERDRSGDRRTDVAGRDRAI